jgi:hypothetical protein
MKFWAIDANNTAVSGGNQTLKFPDIRVGKNYEGYDHKK